MPLVDDGDIIRALGFVTLNAAYLEEAIEACVDLLAVQDLAPPRRIERLPISEQTAYMKRRLAAYGVLPDELAHMPASLDAIDGLFRERNDFIHGRIYGNLEGLPDRLLRGRGRAPDREITSAELISLANDFIAFIPGLNAASMFALPRVFARGYAAP